MKIDKDRLIVSMILTCVVMSWVSFIIWINILAIRWVFG